MTTTTATTQQTDAEIIEEILTKIDEKITLLQTTEDLARRVGQKHRQHHAREGITCLQWAAAYIRHGRFEDAERALEDAKAHMGALA